MQPEFLSLLPDSFAIYLARHATPDRTRYDIPYHILPGPDLTPRGQQEAMELGNFLREAKVGHVLSSPFERARRTAEIACRLAGAPLENNPDLSERQPTEYEALLVERMQRAFRLGAEISAARGPLAIISHGAPIMVLLRSLGLPGRIIENCRIYDNRNMVPMAGAWWVERDDGELNMRLAFAPQGNKVPEFQGISIPKTIPAEKVEPRAELAANAEADARAEAGTEPSPLADSPLL